MKKLKPVILVSIICAIFFFINVFWVFEYGWSFLPYLILSGCFMVWVQKENFSYKFLDKLLIGSLVFGFLAMVLSFFRIYATSRFVYDTPFSFSELWDKDILIMSAVFAFVSFLGGLLGIVLKGFYFLYKEGLNKILLFAGPLIILFSSLAVYRIKIGGTVMSSLHGWPYPFLSHQIKDVVDGFLIDKWVFLSGSFYHYIVFNYLLYLIFFTLAYFLVKFINQKLKTKKLNNVLILFGFLIVMVLVFTSFLSIKKSYISYQITWSGKCEKDSDCVIVTNRAPFSCAIVSSKDNKDRILNLVNSFPSAGELECSGNEKAVCLQNKCRISTSAERNQGMLQNDKVWIDIVHSIRNCHVVKIFQAHNLGVTATLKDGRILEAVEPRIDDVIKIAEDARIKCGKIIIGTE